jgi:SAM-dependent methyltransferase
VNGAKIFTSDEYLDNLDPYGYTDNPHDLNRKNMFLSYLPKMEYERVLDIGVGTGFITRDLPFKEFVGLDTSETAISHLNNYFEASGKTQTHKGVSMSLFDKKIESLGDFDLIILTGILYPHYLGENRVVVNQTLAKISRPNCIVISVHISDWSPYTLDESFVEIDRWFYPYRTYTHELTVMRKVQ